MPGEPAAEARRSPKPTRSAPGPPRVPRGPSQTAVTPVRFRRHSPKAKLRKPASLPGQPAPSPSDRRVSRSRPLPGRVKSRQASSGRSPLPPQRQTGAVCFRGGALPHAPDHPPKDVPVPSVRLSPGRRKVRLATRRKRVPAELKGRRNIRRVPPERAYLPRAVPGEGRGGYASPVLKL
jgi:hypothetical protein